MGDAAIGLRLLQRPRQVEASLWRRFRYESDDQCREQIFTLHVPLARMIARGEFRRRPPYGLEQADFDHLAFNGLLEAIDRYDPLQGAPFDAFARKRIKGAISDGLTKSSEGGAQYAYRRRIEIERVNALRPGPSELENPFNALADLAIGLAYGLIAEGALQSAVDPRSGLEAYDNVAWRDLELRILQDIETLADNERTVLKQHYLNDVPFQEIARLLGVSKGRVSQIHRAALNRLRARLCPTDERVK